MEISNKKIRDILRENLLKESQESTSQHEAIKYAMNKMGWNKEEADKFVRVDLRNDITSLRDKKIGKFTLGITRMVLDGELSDARMISDINSTLKLMLPHLNEYDRNLNGLNAQVLIDRFSQARMSNLENEKNEIDNMEFNGGRYNIVPINTFEDAQRYYNYTYKGSPWCLTHMRNMFESYTCNGLNQIYFCLEEGFENIEPYSGENCPLDEYGLSMISVIVNEVGELAYCTCRWNHANGGNDSIMNAKEISQVIGVNFYQVFKPNNKWSNKIGDLQKRLDSGEDIEKIFGGDVSERGGLYYVVVDGKENVIKDRKFLFKKWYEYVYEIDENNLFIINQNHKYNLINLNGELLSNVWYDNIKVGTGIYVICDKSLGKKYLTSDGRLIGDEYFNRCYDVHDGFGRVENKEGNDNFVNINSGKLLSNIWYDNARDFSNGLAAVYIEDKGWDFINKNGQIVFNEWFNGAGDYKYGVIPVYKNYKFYYIDIYGDNICNDTFDEVRNFSEGYGLVFKNNVGYNYINNKGEFLLKEWFLNATSFKNGFGTICDLKRNAKWNYVTKNGTILSDIWFDENKTFNEDGFGEVQINNKYNLIDREGKLLLQEWAYSIGSFNDGWAKVYFGNTKGYNFINKEGLLISNKNFSDATDFINGKCAVRYWRDKRRYYLDINGNNIIN